jgi:hypothetical protein
VRAFAITAAFLQTLHVRIGHEPKAAAILWASLPIGAMLVYEIHIRWERRKALARAGSVYPSPLPQFGFMTWLLFPLSTLTQLRTITLARRAALVTAANVVVADFQRATSRVRNTRERYEEAAADATEPSRPIPAAEPDAKVADEDVMREHRARHARKPEAAARAARTEWARSHSPKARMREWAKAQPQYEGRVGEHGRIHADIQEAYYEAHPEERSG